MSDDKELLQLVKDLAKKIANNLPEEVAAISIAVANLTDAVSYQQRAIDSLIGDKNMLQTHAKKTFGPN